MERLYVRGRGNPRDCVLAQKVAPRPERVNLCRGEVSGNESSIELLLHGVDEFGGLLLPGCQMI